MKNGIKSLAVWLIIGVILAVGINAIYDNNDRKFSYTQLMEKVQNGQVQTIMISSGGESADITFNDGTTDKKVNIPDIQTLMKDVEAPVKENKLS